MSRLLAKGNESCCVNVAAFALLALSVNLWRAGRSASVGNLAFNEICVLGGDRMP
jgi:hypothetical protein